jgi:hypothetical protein
MFRLRLAFAVAIAVSFQSAHAHDHTLEAARARIAAAQARAEAEADHTIETLPDDQVCRLTVELIDANRTQPGLVRVINGKSGHPYVLTDGIHRARNWYAVSRSATLRVPRAQVRIEGFRGIETEVAAASLDLTGKATASARLPLVRFANAHAQGWRSGNTHLHLMRQSRDEAERYLRDVPAADGLDLVFLSFLRRAGAEREYISNAFTRDDLDRLSRGGEVLYDNGEEHRHNFGPQGEGYGHVMFLHLARLIEPVSIGPGIMLEGTDGLPLQRGIVRARGDGAGVIWCHNSFGHEDIPNWLAGLLDAQNIFDGGEHGHYADTFYRYLNLGLKVPFSTGTDWFIYDFSRVYVPVDGALTSRRWLDALAAGRSYITNGPLLEFTVDGRKIGDTISLDGPRRLRVNGRAIGRRNFQSLELINNGRVTQRAEAIHEGGHFIAALDLDVSVDEPGWFALRIPVESGTNELDQPLFAHTSPVYVTVARRHIFRRDEAERLRQNLERSIETIRKQGSFSNETERDAVMEVYRDGLRKLDERIASQRPPR